MHGGQVRQVPEVWSFETMGQLGTVEKKRMYLHGHVQEQ
jgi:hypothetical protein